MIDTIDWYQKSIDTKMNDLDLCEIKYGKSNGHVTTDVTWLRNVKLATPIRLEPNIWKIAGYAMATIDLVSLLWDSTVGFHSDSMASC